MKISANEEHIVMGSDPLNVIADVVKPLPDHVLKRVIEGRKERTQILDGSMLEQHDHLKPYAYTHVTMDFENEDDLIRCARLLQWSDERMRSRTDPKIMWAWQESFRDGMRLEFSVAWYSEEFFREQQDAFMNAEHAAYYAKFGLNVGDIKTKHQIVGK